MPEIPLNINLSGRIGLIIKAALSVEHGAPTVEEKVSGYYLADEIEMTCRGMMIAIKEEEWFLYRDATPFQLVRLLKQLSKNVKMAKHLKHPRGPKRPKVMLKSDRNRPHVSTARLIANRKK